MIKIEKQYAKTRSNDDLIEVTRKTAANGGVDAVYETLSKDLKGVKCENHPNHTSRIVIKANPKDLNKQFSVEKKDFCCNEFKDSLDIQINFNS